MVLNILLILYILNIKQHISKAVNLCLFICIMNQLSALEIIKGLFKEAALEKDSDPNRIIVIQMSWFKNVTLFKLLYDRENEMIHWFLSFHYFHAAFNGNHMFKQRLVIRQWAIFSTNSVRVWQAIELWDGFFYTQPTSRC